MIGKLRHGGSRLGAGRPKKSGRYGESTKPVRVPESLIPYFEAVLGEYAEYGEEHIGLNLKDASCVFQVPEEAGFLPLILYSSRVAAGSPAPADDFVEGKLDLNQYLVKHPATTFYVKVSGDSMVNAGIFPDDILVVDRSLEPAHGKIIIAVVNGELTVKRLYVCDSAVRLVPENASHRSISITDDDSFSVWGVVSGVVRQV